MLYQCSVPSARLSVWNRMMLNPHQPMTINTVSSYSDFGNYLSTNGGFPIATTSTFRLSNDKFLTRRLSQALTVEEKRENHNENERNRRKGLNGYIETFRSLFPYLIKKDKASVLGELVWQLRELNKKVTNMRSVEDDPAEGNQEGGVNSSAMGLLLPDDTDNVNVQPADRADGSSIMIATLSCEDRENLIPEIIRALDSAKGRAIRAEMATVGGRVKIKLWVQLVGGGGDVATSNDGTGGKNEVSLALHRALKAVVDKERTGHHPFYRSG